jgi:hypothetical protein
MFSGFHVTIAHPQVVHGGDGFHTWRAVVNMLNKELKDSQQGMISDLGLTVPHHKVFACYEMP